MISLFPFLTHHFEFLTGSFAKFDNLIERLIVLRDSKDGIEFLLQFLCLIQGPAGVLLMTEQDTIYNGLGHAHEVTNSHVSVDTTIAHRLGIL